MRNEIFFTIAMTVFSLPTFAEVELDLAKFRAKGEQTLAANAAGLTQMVPAETVYVDGASAFDAAVVFDQSSFLVSLPVRAESSLSEWRIAFRLGLNGTQALVLFKTDSAGQLFFAVPNSGIVTFNNEASEMQIEKFVRDLRTAFPSGEIQYLSSIKSLIYVVPLSEVDLIYGFLEDSALIASVQMDQEAYHQPYFFEAPVSIADEIQHVNADQYRTRTKILKEDGVKFATETTVPEDLQYRESSPFYFSKRALTN